MTLKQLEAFYWCAVCANFAVAAARLNIAVSSISKRVAELEVSLGAELFDRSGHTASLTGAGERLLPKALRVLEASADLKTSLKGSHELRGTCVFGIGELTAMTWFPSWMALTQRRHPDLVLEPYVDMGRVLEEKLVKGELDFAIVAGRSSNSRIVSSPLGSANFEWMASPELNHRGRGRCNDLFRQGVPLVALPPSAGTTHLIDEWLISEAIGQVSRLSCNNWIAVISLLALSTGIGIVPQGWATVLASSGKLSRLNDERPLSSMTYCFQSRLGDTRPLIIEMHALAKTVADYSRSVVFD